MTNEELILYRTGKTFRAELERDFLERAKRRTIEAKVEAKISGININAARSIIKSLLRKKLIYRSDHAKPSYTGGVSATYRAT